MKGSDKDNYIDSYFSDRKTNILLTMASLSTKHNLILIVTLTMTLVTFSQGQGFGGKFHFRQDAKGNHSQVHFKPDHPDRGYVKNCCKFHLYH